jgi:hypothetical protein
LHLPVVPAGKQYDEVPDELDLWDLVRRRVEASELRQRVRCLPPTVRAVVVLRYGLVGVPRSRTEIERGLCLAPGSARAIERRALDYLRDSYGA